jgi:putative FmdB family regulatory protein
MPIYEYACKKCGEFEVTQRITEDPLKKCPSCGRKVTKLISQSAFHLRGSGWYATDYSKNGSGKSDSDDTKETTTNSEKKDSSGSASSSNSSDKSTKSTTSSASS